MHVFINKICVVVVIIREQTKRIVSNISITVNKIYNKWVQCAIFFTPMVTLDFMLQNWKFSAKSPRTITSFAFMDSFLALRKLGWHKINVFSYDIYYWYQSVFKLFTGWCDSYQGSSVCSWPLWVVKMKIRIYVTELLIQKFTQCVCSWTGTATMHHTFTMDHTLIQWQDLCM